MLALISKISLFVVRDCDAYISQTLIFFGGHKSLDGLMLGYYSLGTMRSVFVRYARSGPISTRERAQFSCGPVRGSCAGCQGVLPARRSHAAAAFCFFCRGVGGELERRSRSRAARSVKKARRRPSSRRRAALAGPPLTRQSRRRRARAKGDPTPGFACHGSPRSGITSNFTTAMGLC